MRVSAYIDGFNLYHALDERQLDHLKWVDLRRLCEVFAPGPDIRLGAVYYFSAYATWRPGAYARHRSFVAALTSNGVTPVMGSFKGKLQSCRACGTTWTRHEEKETDVNIALYLLRDAYENAFDRALIVSGDSDLAPAIRMVREQFPQKAVRIIAPYGREYSMDLVHAAGGIRNARKMRLLHLERSALPAMVHDEHGALVAERPAKYAPPSG